MTSVNTSTDPSIPFPEVTTASMDGQDERCQQLDTNYDIAIAIICGMHILFGIFYSLFGYRCFKAVMFLTGFIFASVLVYLVCLEEDLMSTYGNAGVALGTGFLFGLITMLVYYVGLFVTGLHTGLLLGVIILTVVEEYCVLTNMWITVGILLGSSLFMAVLTLSFQKALTIVGTSVYGGAILAAALDYYVEKFRMVIWLWDRIKLEKSPQPCWFSWLLLSVWPFMVVVGTATQTFITGRDFYHKYRGQRSRHSRSSKRPDSENVIRPRPGPRRYRYVYQVRTAHGDVISQRYIQALRKMVPHAAKTSTLQSAYALCPGESDNEANNGGTWSTTGTNNDPMRHNEF